MNITTLLAARGLGIGVIIAERTDPRYHAVGRVWSVLRRRLYPSCQSLVVQTASVQPWARTIVRTRPVFVIPNAAVAPKRRASKQHAPGDRRMVTLGRLSPEKGADLLIKAFARVAADFPNWSLSIYGSGALQAELESLCAELQLDDRVTLHGWTSDTAAALSTADLFVLPSRYEGFPNALLEAMAAGLACISFDCESGPREIIHDQKDGLLVPPQDVEALARAMAQLMADDSERCRLGNQAREVVTRFSEERFYRQWDAVVAGVSETEFEQSETMTIKEED
jgi:glycosyltransferase involved in cell wall biosynthesis